MRTNRLKLVMTLIAFLPVYLIAQESYQEWLKKDQQAFQQFLEKEDRAFMEFLKKDWKAFQSMDGEKRDVKPKPKNLPVAEPAPTERISVKPKAPVKVKPLPPVPKPKPIPEKPAPQANIQYEFYGVPVAFMLEKKPEIELPGQINNESISQAWGVLASTPSVKLIPQLKKQREALRLNDWGYVQLVHELSRSVYKGQRDQQILMTWFLLVKSGYDARIAYKRDRVFLLLSNENTVYDNQFVTLNKQKYYFVTFSGTPDLSGQVYTYEGNYEGSNTQLSMKLAAVPNLTNEISTRKLEFKYNGQPFSFAIKYDRDVVNFFKQYPQTEIGLYFHSPVSADAQTTLLKALKPHLEGKSELEAVNFLLRFVQTAFDYKTDDQQFGREKYLLPEETIFYPSSDCEDRSILFSYLVKNLLGMQVVGLDYPGHIATAINFNMDVKGDAVNYKGKKYIICDPTFINANAGMCMPEFKKVNPEIIQL